MAYKFQRGEAILSGALVQEGNIEIESGFEFSMHEETVLDTSRNLTVAGMSGSGNLEVGGTVRLGGVADASAVATDKMYFLDSDGLMKANAIEDVRDFLIFDSVSGDATIAYGGELTIAAGAVENSMLSGGIASTKIAELNNFDTDALTEGASNLYYTDARVHAALSVSDSNSIDMTYDAAGDFSAALRISGSQLEVVGEGLRLTAQAADGTTMALSSDSLSVLKVPNTLSQGEGVAAFSFDGSGTATVGLSASVAGDGLGYSSGVLSVNVHGNGGIEVDTDALQIKAGGVTNDMLSGSIASSKIAELNAFDTDALGEGSSNLYYTEARWDAKMAAADTDDLAEGASSLYFTDARARAAVSVTDAGGDGSLAYDSSTGVFTYTGPSAAEVRAHLSVADTNSIDMSFASGSFSADLLLSGSSLEVTAAGLRLAAAAAGAGLAWTDGVLSVQGNDVHLKADSGTLQEGYNYFAAIAASGSASVTLPASPENGDVVHVKAGDLGGDAYITIGRAGSQTIDGETSIVLESPFAAVSLVYIENLDAWRII